MLQKSSLIALFTCYLIMTYTAFFFYPKWEKSATEATISWDASGYYMYLPSLFIYNDIKHCQFKDSILSKYNPTPDFQQAFIHKGSGNYVMKYSCGQAMVMLPFFLIAHTYSYFNHSYPADGFSFPYQISIGIGMFIISLLGLFLLRRILLIYFKDTIVSILLFCFVIGSNYLNYSSIDQAMTHSILFTLYCLLIALTIEFSKSPKITYSIYIGLVIGLATLIRPTEIISIIIPFLWGINSKKDFIAKYDIVKTNFVKYFIIVLLVPLVFSIQMVYWKYVANEWLVYSYQDQGFSWLKPHIGNYTFSYNCGWLRYCPMMILPLVGLIYYIVKGQNRFAIISFILINSYIVMAWDIWDYGGISGRAMVQSYPILAFPFCLFIQQMLKTKKNTLLLFATIGIFSYMNIWWTYHAHAGNIQTSGLTKEYFWRVVGKWNGTDEDKKLLDNNFVFFETPSNPTVLYSNNFNDTSSSIDHKTNSNFCIKVNSEIQCSPVYTIKNALKCKKIIRAYADFKCTKKEWNMWKQTQFILTFYNKNEKTQTNLIRVDRLLNSGDVKRIYIDAITPTKEWSDLKISFLNCNGNSEMLIDNLSVVTFDN